MLTHYFEIYAFQQRNIVINQLFNKIHGFIRKNNVNIAIDLPKLTNNDIECDIGNVIRIFGDREDLEKLIEEKRFSNYINFVAGVKFGNIKEIPEIHTFISIYRIRAKDKGLISGNYAYFNYEKKQDNSNNKIMIHIDRKIVKDLGKGEYTSFGLCRKESGIPYF